jgi:acyl-CoA synthetase (AMP-forming)/AMP-acid ligase II
MDSLVAALRRNAEATPDKPAVIHSRRIADGVGELTLSYAELDRAAAATAIWLRERCRAGDRALLLYPNGLDFVTAFLGCLYAGVTPVPAPLPEVNRTSADRTASIARDCLPAIVLTDAVNLWAVSARLHQNGLESVPAVATDTEALPDPAGWRDLPCDPDSLALLQYTSGSTSDPKGVMVSHGNLMHNFEVEQRLLGWTGDMRFCSWLPVYHDMGLISMLLVPLFLGGTAIVMSPTDFLKHPVGWLQLIDRHGVVASGAPNFAFDLCRRRVTDDQVAALDLSRWRYACNGSEPIDHRTLRLFAERFAPAGFRAEALTPGYGMAEATLFVAGTRPAGLPVVTPVNAESLRKNVFEPVSADGDGQALVSSGVVDGLDVRVVDPVSAEVLPDTAVGEIWIRGGSVAQGYWRKEEQTERTFRARTSTGEGDFLRTGDLGVLHDGELYITGRIKELLIIHGRNLYPADIEALVRDLGEPFASLPCCAFSVPAPHEEVVIVQEVRRRGLDEVAMRTLAATIRTTLSRKLDIRVAGVVLTRLGQIRKTTSGKTQRLAVRELFMSDLLLTLYEDLDPKLRDRYRRAVDPVAEPVGKTV